MEFTRERLANLAITALVAAVVGFGGGYYGSAFHPGPKGEVGAAGPQGPVGPVGPVPTNLGFCVWSAGVADEFFTPNGNTNVAVPQSRNYCLQTGGEYVIVGSAP